MAGALRDGPRLAALGASARVRTAAGSTRWDGAGADRARPGGPALAGSRGERARRGAALGDGTRHVPGLWSVAVLVALGIGVGAREGYALFVRGDRLGPGWRDRSGRVLACAGGSALAGPLAAAIRLSLAVGPAGGGIPSSAPWSELAAASGLAALGLSGALLLALLWLLLRTRAASVLRARRELRQAVGPWEDTEPEETLADGAQYDHAFTDGALADDGLARRERNSGLERETTP